MTSTDIASSTTTASAAEVVGRLRATYTSGVTRPLEWRIAQLTRLRTLLVENEQAFIDALWADLRKPVSEAKVQEIDATVHDIDKAIASLEGWLEPQPLAVPDAFGPAVTAKTVLDPLGVALVIAPWNYPVHLMIDPIIGALAAGNTVVAKPSEVSPHTSAVISQLVPRYFDDSVVAVVEGGVAETTALLEQRFDHIFYTGNASVARIVMAAAAKNLTPVTLELGGKSPVYIAPDVDIDETARRIVAVKFFNAGQACVAPDYILADASTRASLVPALQRAVAEKFGPEPQASQEFGRIINARHFDRLANLLGSGDAVVGGEHDRDDLFIAPTVLAGVTGDDDVMKEEIFGPILPIVDVEGLDGAIDFINDREKPLALYAFTASETTKARILNETSSGGVAWGQPNLQLMIPGLPFGGVGESGMGRYHGRHSLETFSHVRTVVELPLN